MRTFDVRSGMSCRRWISPIGGGITVFEARSWKSSSAVTFPIGTPEAYGVECNLFKDFQPLVFCAQGARRKPRSNGRGFFLLVRGDHACPPAVSRRHGQSRNSGRNNQNSRCKNPNQMLTTILPIKTLSTVISSMVIAVPPHGDYLGFCM